MATYEYCCSECGPYEVRLPMGTASVSGVCAKCGHPARRVFSAPHLSRVPSALAVALAGEERSQDEPVVVSGAPRERRRPRPHPATARLPRP
ncbi:FmdB family zinc ribbon protein [Streptosporangium soli]